MACRGGKDGIRSVGLTLETYGLSASQTKNLNQKYGLGFPWRKRWDSNPCAEKSTTAFRVQLVMTTSILFRLLKSLYTLIYTFANKKVLCVDNFLY